MSFSEKLRVLRKEKGLSQEQLAEMVNVSRQAVSKWESEQAYPELDKLILLSDFFNISLDDLIKDKNPEDVAKNNDNSDSKEDDEETDEWLIVGGFIVGVAIGLITENFMWGTIGAFLGLGLGYILKGIKKV
ncbi:helix-turn-helix domain-containing protein [Desulfitobacterium hafniense]|nr:helix-turn-helix transcriptional regulator [Desulfitobacterium hafniense]KTE89138.1 transcriptional regulator [Desulfitobacterium hafniense]